MGIGSSELIILVVIGLITVVPGIAGLGVLIWLIVRKKPTRGSNAPPNDPGNI